MGFMVREMTKMLTRIEKHCRVGGAPVVVVGSAEVSVSLFSHWLFGHSGCWPAIPTISIHPVTPSLSPAPLPSVGCCPAIRCPIVVPFRPLFGGSLSSPSGHSDHCSAILDAAVAPRPLFGRRGHLRPLLSSLSGNLHSDAVRPLRPLLSLSGRSSVSIGVWSSSSSSDYAFGPSSRPSVYFSVSVALLVSMSPTLRSRTFCSFVRPIPVSLCLSSSLCDWPPLF